jgi:hypothetical protein
MSIRVDRLNLADRHVRINLRRDNRRMAEQCLNDPEMGASLEHVCCRPMPEGVGVNPLTFASRHTIF